jgi:hypothetical protein
LLLLAPSLAFAASEDDDTDDTMKALGVEETKFEVADKTSGKKLEVPASDDSIRFDLSLETKHRDDGLPYLDPFLGREVYPELSAQLGTRFVARKTANGGEPNGKDGRMTLVGRLDASAWFVDARVPFDSNRRADEGVVEIVLRAPFSAGSHHFAPMLIIHSPMSQGIDESVLEIAFGYHYARAGFGLKLEVSGFDGSHDRRRTRSAGMIGWNAELSYLFGEVVGIVVEVDGATAISERKSATPPELGDTIVRFAPGLRAFPLDAGLSLGLAGLFTFVPDGYAGFERDAGVLVDLGYTFF